MSSKVALYITKELSVLSKYFAFLMLWKSTPSLLVCHSIFSGVGVDEITDFIVVLDSYNVGEISKSLTLGTLVIQCEQNSKIWYFSEVRVCVRARAQNICKI